MLDRESSITLINEKNSNFTVNVRKVIAAYKGNFINADKDERYKWEGIGWYQAHWDIEASDFAAMAASAFSKMSNLLNSGLYYPYKMLTGYASEDPESVRGLFRMLYDESLPLEQRYTLFREGFDRYLEQIRMREPDRQKALQHFQDLRAVMVYLTCRYPEKYFLYKSKMYTAFRDRTGFIEDKPRQKTAVWK